MPYYRPGAPAPNNRFTSTAGGPYTDFGVNRNTFYGLVNRDYYSIKQDIGTVGGEVAITPDLTLSNKTRVQRSVLDYIGTLPEGPNAALGTVSLNPQSRYQVTENVANQTEATYKFDVGGWKNTALGGVEISREIASIDKYAGLSSEQLPGGTTSGSIPGANVFAPQFTFANVGTNPTWAGLPTKVAIDTKSAYLIDTANYNDFVILNGGVRFDDYNIKVSGFGTQGTTPNVFGAQEQHYGLPNFNLGLTLKPLPIGSVYVAYATSSNPVGAEFDGTSVQYGGLAPVLNGNPNQIFGPEKNKAIEAGTKWELFDRHLLVTAALFQTEKENARESRTVNGVSLISAGAAYRIRGIDLGMSGKLTDKWSVFGGLVLMQSEVTQSLVPSMLTKYQLTDVWEIGGQAVYRSKMYGGTFLAANQGTELPSYWRFDTFVEARIDPNWTAKLYVANLTNKLYYDALYQSATPFVFVAPGRSVSMILSARF